MRLLTLNLLACLKCEQFPLSIADGEKSPLTVEYIPVAFDETFVRRMLNRIDYEIFLQGVVGYRRAFQSSLLAAAASDAVLEDVLVQQGSVKLTARDILERPLPPTLEALTTAITPSGVGEDAEEGDGFITQDIVQQHLLMLLHTLLEGLAVRNGALHCAACEASYPVQEFIPSFVVA